MPPFGEVLALGAPREIVREAGVAGAANGEEAGNVLEDGWQAGNDPIVRSPIVADSLDPTLEPCPREPGLHDTSGEDHFVESDSVGVATAWASIYVRC